MPTAGASPWWTAILAASVATIGVVVGAWITQRRTDKREERRWQREAEERRAQWERERAERYGQWEREDKVRWHADRRAHYADAIAVLDDWGRHTVAWDINPELLAEQAPPVLKALALAGLIAGPETADQVRYLADGVTALTDYAGSAAADTFPDDFSPVVYIANGALLLAHGLRDIARMDIGIQEQISVKTSDLKRTLRAEQTRLLAAMEADKVGPAWSVPTTYLLHRLLDPDKPFPYEDC
jgi:hypothetical protein